MYLRRGEWECDRDQFGLCHYANLRYYSVMSTTKELNKCRKYGKA